MILWGPVTALRQSGLEDDVTQVTSHSKRSLPSAARPVSGSVLVLVCLLIAILGVALAFYAMLGLPSNEHSGMDAARGWVQFLFAAAVPLSATAGVVGGAKLYSGEAGAGLALAGLATALLCVGGWVLVFFNWTA